MKTIIILVVMLLTLLSCAPQQNPGLPTVFRNCRVITPEGVIENGMIVVDGSKIVYAGPQADDIVRGDVITLDASGLTALPLLFNAHIHNAFHPERLRLFLSGGVGTVRDLAPSSLSTISQPRPDLFAADKARVVASSPMITVAGGYGNLIVETAEEARQRVREFSAQGALIIKTSVEDYCQGRTWRLIPEEILRALVEEAHKLGKKVTAHVTYARNFRIALACGVDEIAHMIIDRLEDADIALAAARDVSITPTLELWEGVQRLHGGQYLENALDNLGRLHAAGVKIVLGTDFAGYVFQFEEGFPATEIALMKRAGMDNLAIIRAATLNAAESCGLSDLGALRQGAVADILLVRGKPDENIEDLAKIKIIMKNGTIAGQR